jgi:adenine-specific DNA-methyltransferase
VIKYLGSKRLLLPHLGRVFCLAAAGNPHPFFLDAFSGTSRVGLLAKSLGFRVTAADYAYYAWYLAAAHVAAPEELLKKELPLLLEALQGVTPIDGYFTETYARRSRFFTVENAMKIDGIREAIDVWPEFHSRDSESVTNGTPLLRAAALVALMEAADRVDSTVGLQMAYLKQYAKRAYDPLTLRMPDTTPTCIDRDGQPIRCRARRSDVFSVVQKQKYDIIYFDPPYNQHSYLGNYHIWETLALNDKPEVYGVACKRLDTKEHKSDFNSKVKGPPTLKRLIEEASGQTQDLVLSYSSDAFVPAEEIRDWLQGNFQGVVLLQVPHKRHVGSKIGIYDLKGNKVGDPGEEKNTEFVFWASHDPYKMRSSVLLLG